MADPKSAAGMATTRAIAILNATDSMEGAMRYLFVFVIALFPPLLFAQEANNYRCVLGDLTRRIEIVSETGVTVPCEVHYYKDTEAPGEQQVLWRAINESGYCEARAKELADKLRGMGWNCLAAAEPGPDAEPEETDDTDALTPADEIEIPESDPTGTR